MSEVNTKTTVVLPIHKMDDTIMEFFSKAINGVGGQKVKPEELLIVIPSNSDFKTTLDEYDYGDIKNIVRIIENDGETDFCSQVNFAANNEVNTEYFSILEVDDEYSIIWFDNVIKYMEAYEDVEVFLPIVLDVNTEDGKFLHFTNEPVWAKDFSDKLGYLDNDSLLNFPNFQLSGAVISLEAFKAVGGLKPSIRIQFVYEFFLRMSYYDKKMMTIPKLGYRKSNMRPDSLFYNYFYKEEDKIDAVEARFWFNTARKECYFKQDRGITYMQGAEE